MSINLLYYAKHMLHLVWVHNLLYIIMLSLFLLSIFGAFLSALIGTIWYSSATPMGKVHIEYLGFNKLSKEEQEKKIKEMKPKMPKMYAAQILLSLLTSFATVFIVGMSMGNGLPFIMAAGFVTMNWLCFMVPIIGSNILWSNCDRKLAWKKFFSEIFANLVTVLAIAYITSFFI